MNFRIAHDRLAKHLVWIIGQAVLVLVPVAAAYAETPKESPGVEPVESLWLVMTSNDSSGFVGREQALKQWQQAKVFDAFAINKFPPTLSGDKDFNGRANALIDEVGGRFIIFIVPVGKEGWETSANQRLGQKMAAAGGHYDASKAMTQPQWLETLNDLHTDTWVWMLELPARMPTPEEGARSASEFVRLAKAQHKKAAIWLSAEAFGHPSLEKGMLDWILMMEQRICEATRADADYFGWMDLPKTSLQAGESKWLETMAKVLDKILMLTPKEKTVMQLTHQPQLPTKDVEGTRAYIGACQAKGINRFCLLSSPQFLERAPWREFYRTLPKTGAAAAK